MSFFDNIKMYAPMGMSAKEVNDKLGVVEVALFNDCPFLLELPEEQQNKIVEYVWKLHCRSMMV